ncbi:conserved hypothetical protein [Perkinsus marinus ATCC 50983]|uniref:Uncharacterized protein n=1 Tax=Perkinsus marinus (strain ATCC 50983 / TXsc) TaxID=423536 RepID=C5KCL3_PERM5|nr:conserved hypothetical protein [Perkinsus marinus ATCC 50983]EER17612.1 conserved hypothetical protein [Perkinsus marinus ATCC 50983]|eukprot:XP_002785816.1 conserved hypothetical protein [Perkinsus marinus ATCC 50983]
MFSEAFDATALPKSHGMSKTAKVVAGATACTLAVGAGYYLYNRRQRVRKSEVERLASLDLEKLKLITDDLLVDMHGVLMEMAQMTQRVRTALAQKGLSNQMTDDQLTEMILQQGIQQKLEETQKQVLKKYGVTAEEVEAAQKRYESDEHIQQFEKGIDAMFASATKGKMPIIPGFEMPEALTVDMCLKILEAVNTEKLARFRKTLKEFWQKHPHPVDADQAELGGALQEANDSAEAAAVARYAEIVVNKAVLHSAVATYMTKDKAFAKERTRLERTQQLEIVKMIKAGPEGIDALGASTPIELIDGLSDRLEGTNEEGLTVRLLQASDDKSGVVVVITKTMKDAAKLMKPISDAIDSGKFDKRKDLQFVYMAAAADSPLIQSERCKKCDIVYVLFPRPDLQQRPVACLSLEELLDAINDEQMFSDKGVGLLKMSTSAAMSSEGAKASTTKGVADLD